MLIKKYYYKIKPDNHIDSNENSAKSTPCINNAFTI